MAPYELILYSFLDGAGVEQLFTTTDFDQARAYAAQHHLVILCNHYEFVASAPVADFTGPAVLIA
jgi:hypothetical protein